MSGVIRQMSGVRCQVSRVRCNVSGVTCQVSHVSFFLFLFFSDKVVKLVGGGFVIYRAYPV